MQDTKKMMLTFLTPEGERAATDFTINERIKKAGLTIKMYMDRWGGDRRELEREWLNCWAEYYSNHRAAEHLRTDSLQVTGQDVMARSRKWRHKITTGKAFELVETVNSYLQSAFFPNQQWFDLYPKAVMPNEDWEEVLHILTHYLINKYDEARFKTFWEVFCRQLLITGNSVLALPWRYDAIKTYKNTPKTKKGKTEYLPTETIKVIQNNFDFQVVDMFDFYLDPAATDPYKANCIRRIVKRRGELVRLIEQGIYPLAEKSDVMNADSYTPNSISTTNKESLKFFGGAESEWQQNEEYVAIYEFWGDLQIDDYEFCNVCATVCGDKLISIMPNPYWGGRPFVIGSLISIHDSPYSIGILQPVLGQLHGMFEISNHRLDVDELTINPALLVSNDGSIDYNSLYLEPGKVIPVEDTETSIQPLQLPNQTNVSVQDETLLEQRIDKTTGVGAYVGVNSGRQAERVTAEEIAAQKDAGGNRLGGYHKHIENTALKEFLTKSYQYLQQFVITDEVVRIKKQVQQSFKEQYDYFQVGQEELQHEMDIVPVGSDYIINKEFELQQRIDFFTFVSQYPELAKYINWQESIKDLARRFLKQDWDKFIMFPDEQPSPVPGEMDIMAQMQGGQQMPQDPSMMPPGATPMAEASLTGSADTDAYLAQMEQDPMMAMQAVENYTKRNPI